MGEFVEPCPLLCSLIWLPQNRSRDESLLCSSVAYVCDPVKLTAQRLVRSWRGKQSVLIDWKVRRMKDFPRDLIPLLLFLAVFLFLLLALAVTLKLETFAPDYPNHKFSHRSRRPLLRDQGVKSGESLYAIPVPVLRQMFDVGTLFPPRFSKKRSLCCTVMKKEREKLTCMQGCGDERRTRCLTEWCCWLCGAKDDDDDDEPKRRERDCWSDGGSEREQQQQTHWERAKSLARSLSQSTQTEKKGERSERDDAVRWSGSRVRETEREEVNRASERMGRERGNDTAAASVSAGEGTALLYQSAAADTRAGSRIRNQLLFSLFGRVSCMCCRPSLVCSPK